MDFDPPADIPKLREYQLTSVDEVRSHLRETSINSVLLQAPTGAGKTVIACEIMRACDEKGTRVAFLAHRRELVRQSSAKLHEFGVNHGVVMAGEQMLTRNVQVCSIQTLASWLKRGRIDPFWVGGVLIIDECHRSLAQSYLDMIELGGEKTVLIGLSATPARSDGRGLGDVYQRMVQCPSILDLIRQGFLVDPKYFAPTIPDLEGVRVHGGDYVEADLASKMDKPKLVGDVVENWGRIASDRKTVVFASSVAHSIHLSEEFQAAGVAAEHIDGETPKDERDATLRRLSNGDLQVICNCMVLTEGWDQPDVSCCVLARPTKSIVMYLQMAGRVLRTAPGKDDALIIDHAGAVHEHGFIHEFTDWTLEPTQKQMNPVQEMRERENAKPIVCQNCFATFTGRRTCPSCGAALPRQGASVEYLPGDLGVIDPSTKKTEKVKHTMETKRRWFAELVGLGVEQVRHEKWADHTYRKKFGVWPNGLDRTPASAGAEVRRYARHRAIAYAKSMKAKDGGNG